MLNNGGSGRPEVFIPPGEPSQVLVQAFPATGILEVHWSEPFIGGNNVTEYVVWFRTDRDPPENWNLIRTTTSPGTIHGIIPGLRYSFKVSVTSCLGSGPFSSTVNWEIPSMRLHSAHPQPPTVHSPLLVDIEPNSLASQFSFPDRVITSRHTIHDPVMTRQNSNPDQVIIRQDSIPDQFMIRQNSIPEQSNQELWTKCRSLQKTSWKPADVLRERGTRSHHARPVYQVKTEYTMKDPDSRTAKCQLSFDSIHRDKEEKVIILLGATGAGKSTLVNALVNHFYGVEWEDSFRLELIPDTESREPKALSQTSWITAYTLPWQEGCQAPYNLTIVDTPGFGDTTGLVGDKSITTQLQTFFTKGESEGLDHLNGIGFVLQASNSRLTPTEKYIMDSILSAFGKDVVNSIYLMITFADSKSPPVLNAVEELDIPHVGEHVNSQHRFQTYTVEETKTMDDLKNSYGKALQGRMTAEKLMFASRQKYEDILNDTMDLVCDAHQNLCELDKIALKPNPLAIGDYLDLLISSESNQIKPGWMERLTKAELDESDMETAEAQFPSSSELSLPVFQGDVQQPLH
ncbi:unnamed protein product [Darwinula stevensoni]|uniref:Fibronectin type-III domain-containing protein n=1 Tax=Darwinula stevensoni TaxID=69355 RepID=A0A7R8ZZ68_9CRUS|nr:unnamed protein product [Darwinula stevensoni]CAG0882938.1 unnamed protein product [Darwinula stevensoni]